MHGHIHNSHGVELATSVGTAFERDCVVMARHWPFGAFVIFTLFASCNAFASPPVYRCETNGRIAYSDAPCVGAKVIDATPTQGVDKMSGKSRKGADVQRTEMNHAFDDALKPLTGKSRSEMDTLRHRSRLPAADQAECARLDRELPELEADARNSDKKVRAEAEVRLYQIRKKFFDLKC